MLHSRSSAFLSCFNDSEMCKAFQCLGFLRDLILVEGIYLHHLKFLCNFTLKSAKLSWKSDQQKSKLFQKQKPKTPINMMISQWKIQPSTKNSFPADPCGNNEGENTQGRLQEQRLRRLRGKGAECRAQGMKLKTHPILGCDISCGFYQMVLSYLSLDFSKIILHLCSFGTFFCFSYCSGLDDQTSARFLSAAWGGQGLCPDPKPLHPTIQSAVAGRREHPVRVTKKSLGDFIWAFP